MKTRLLIASLVLLVASAHGQTFLGSVNGQCAKGGQATVTQGLASAGTQPINGGTLATGTGVIGSYPGCLVTVYNFDSTTLATLFADAAGATPLSNPFASNIDGSFVFFAAPQPRYDVVLSGAGLPSPVTLTGVAPFNPFGMTISPGVFTNAFNSNSFLVSVGACDPNVEQTALDAFPGLTGPFITTPITGCVAAPVGAAIRTAQALTGFATTSSTATQANGVFGGARMLASGTDGIGVTGMFTDAPGLTFMFGAAIGAFVNTSNTDSAYRDLNGVVVEADFSNGPVTHSNGVLVQTFPSTGRQWQNAVVFDNGASANGQVLKGTCQLGGSNTCASQGILLEGVNAGVQGAAVGVTASAVGDLILATTHGHVIQSNNATIFSTLAAASPCSAGLEGSTAPVTDSTTNTWGATITGTGSFHVLAYCDGTNWTVMGK